MSTREIDDDCTGDDCKNKWYTAAKIKDKIVVATNDKTKYEGFEFDRTDLKKLISELMKIGVDGCVQKEKSGENLITALNNIVEGKSYFEDEIEIESQETTKKKILMWI